MRSDVPQRRPASPKTGYECQYSPALRNEDLPVRGYRFVLDVKKKKKLRTVAISNQIQQFAKLNIQGKTWKVRLLCLQTGKALTAIHKSKTRLGL